jgi:hypothetical protein
MALTNIVYDEELVFTIIERWDIGVINNILYDEIMIKIAEVLSWWTPVAYTF